ncbi:hypothetical protein JF531_09275 [Microbacterium esteraromaticum]|uniref:hypothetical protein n=1 Tax=Microbacterium esteraromaticum TaxID=57043 RepID=UPI001A8E0C85|nr:hypothetical protein [Microbacterium esteraromaticum]MBN8424711.1 hypothetical protein [Microbacterium esteraromaticum]
MRKAKEDSIWSDIKQGRRATTSREIHANGLTVDVAQPCVVLGGRSGVGKSRTLKSLQAAITAGGGRALFLDLNRLCQVVHDVLITRDDLAEMKEEYESLDPGELRRGDVQRVVGREYDALSWFSLEFEIANAKIVAELPWTGSADDPTLLPYFELGYRGIDYSSVEMGQGELAVHLLFWILEISREQEDLVLLLDEPDAYLPPVAARAMLARLLRICKERKWSIVMSTHVSEVIEWAIAEDAFVRVSIKDDGSTAFSYSREDEHAGRDLLSREQVSRVLYVEDESALHLTRALVERLGQQAMSTTSVIWGRGAGYLGKVRDYLPRGVRAPIQYAFIADGDQRGAIPSSAEAQWPLLFLPDDPDRLFVAAGNARRDRLAMLLNTDRQTLDRVLEPHEGGDAHDWVNGLGDHFGREATLKALAHLWVEDNTEDADAWVEELSTSLSF